MQPNKRHIQDSRREEEREKENAKFKAGRNKIYRKKEKKKEGKKETALSNKCIDARACSRQPARCCSAAKMHLQIGSQS